MEYRRKTTRIIVKDKSINHEDNKKIALEAIIQIRDRNKLLSPVENERNEAIIILEQNGNADDILGLEKLISNASESERPGNGVPLNLVITAVADIEVDPPVGIVDMVHHALQALAINVGVKDAVDTEVIDLIQVVVADLVAYADLIPLPSIQGKLTLCNCGIAGPRDRREATTQTVDIGATHVIVIEYAYDRETKFIDERETLKFYSLYRQAIIVATHFIGKCPFVPFDVSRHLCRTHFWEGQYARHQRHGEQE